MGSIGVLGRKLDEAVNRQAQVLPTENTAWGFYGEMSRYNYDPKTIHGMNSVWHAAFTALIQAYQNIPSKAIRQFLDSRGGRHFAGAVLDELGGASADASPIDIRMLSKAVEAVIGSARDGAWIAREIEKISGLSIGSPSGTPMSIGERVKDASKAWDEVKLQESKRNWKEREAAMHRLMDAADALLTETRAWFAQKR